MKVSIIVPVYNRAKYIYDIISTVEDQTFTDWELIFVDDGSKDDTSIEINKYLSNKIHLIQLKQNEGQAVARNAAINFAHGKYIAFLDSDDLWEPTKLEKQVKFMEENNIAFSHTSYTFFGTGKQKTIYVPQKLTYEKLLKRPIINTSTVMIDTEQVHKDLIKMPNIRISENTATWLRILENGFVAFGLQESLAIYRTDKDSIAINEPHTIKNSWRFYRGIEKLSFGKSLKNVIINLFNLKNTPTF